MKQHGIGVGYRYPPDFEGSDVGQQYLPDDLASGATTSRSPATRRRSAPGWRRGRRPGRPAAGAPARARAIPGPRPTRQAGGDHADPRGDRRRLAETEKRVSGI